MLPLFLRDIVDSLVSFVTQLESSQRFSGLSASRAKKICMKVIIQILTLFLSKDHHILRSAFQKLDPLPEIPVFYNLNRAHAELRGNISLGKT
jgi:hypothetical protein